MARAIRSSTLETRSARLKLPVSIKPTFIRVAKGLGLGYRRNKSGGVWVMRVADGQRSSWVRTIGAADDFADADGTDVLTFWHSGQGALAGARRSWRDSRAGHRRASARRLRRRSENPRPGRRQCPTDPRSHHQRACRQADHAAGAARIARLARRFDAEDVARVGQPHLLFSKGRSQLGGPAG